MKQRQIQGQQVLNSNEKQKQLLVVQNLLIEMLVLDNSHQESWHFDYYTSMKLDDSEIEVEVGCMTFDDVVVEDERVVEGLIQFGMDCIRLLSILGI